jgi:hypothetical protein
MRGSSQVGEMWESSQVGVMRGSSQVGQMRESSQVGEMWGSSQVNIPESCYCKVDAAKIVLCENATIKDCNTKTIFQSGDWTLVLVQA